MVRRLIEIFDEKQKHTLNYPERFGNKLAGGGGEGVLSRGKSSVHMEEVITTLQEKYVCKFSITLKCAK